MADERIRVCIRMRPLNARETEAKETIAWANDETTMSQAGGAGGSSSRFTFDRVFGQSSTTGELFAAVAYDIVYSSLCGFNGTIFAYGQTSSGKTYTMSGTDQQPGVIPRAVTQIFDHIEASPDREFLLRVSYLEIYNEVIKDLLEPGNTNLKIHENVSKGVFVGGLKEEIVVSAQQVLDLMALGETNRKVGETRMNEKSSRSHSVFRLVIESRGRDDDGDDGAVNVSCLNLVDLAGSERISKTGAEGLRAQEGGHINKSLLTLGQVISRLADDSSSHVPYRDSKLTRILQPSLGGNARTAIICNVTPASRQWEETLSTLKFANRAKNIKNKPLLNEIMDDQALLRKYKRQIDQLKQRLVLATDRNAIATALQELHEEKQTVEQELEEQRRVRAAQEAKISNLQRFILHSTMAPRQSRSRAPRRSGRSARRETWAAPLPSDEDAGTVNTDAAAGAVDDDALREALQDLDVVAEGARSEAMVATMRRRARVSQDSASSAPPALHATPDRSSSTRRSGSNVIEAGVDAVPEPPSPPAARSAHEPSLVNNAVLARVHAQLRERRSQHQALVAELDSLRTELKTSREAELASKDLQEALTEDISALDKQLAEARADAEEQRDRADRAELLVHELQAEVSTASEAIEANEQVMAEQAARLEAADKMVQSSREAMQSALDAARGHEDHATELTNELSETIQALEHATARANRLQEQLGESRDAAAGLLEAQRASEEAEQTIAALKAQLGELEAGKTAADGSMSQLQSDLDASKQQVADLEAALDQSRSDADTAFRQARDHQQALEAELAAAREQCERLTSELDAATAAKDKAAAKLAESQDEVDRLIEADLASQAAAKEAQVELAALKATAAKARDLGAWAREKDRMAARIKELDEKLKHAIQEGNKGISERAAIDREVKQLRKESAALTSRLEKAKAEVEQLRQSARSSTAMEKQFEAQNKALEKLRVEATKLTQERDALRASVTAATEQGSAAETAAAEAAEQLEQLQARLAELQTQHENVSSTLVATNEHVNELTSELAATMEELTAQAARGDELEQKLSAQADALTAEKAAECAKLCEQLTDLGMQAAEAEAEYTRQRGLLQAQIADLERDGGEAQARLAADLAAAREAAEKAQAAWEAKEQRVRSEYDERIHELEQRAETDTAALQEELEKLRADAEAAARAAAEKVTSLEAAAEAERRNAARAAADASEALTTELEAVRAELREAVETRDTVTRQVREEAAKREAEARTASDEAVRQAQLNVEAREQVVRDEERAMTEALREELRVAQEASAKAAADARDAATHREELEALISDQQAMMQELEDDKTRLERQMADMTSGIEQVHAEHAKAAEAWRTHHQGILDQQRAQMALLETEVRGLRQQAASTGTTPGRLAVLEAERRRLKAELADARDALKQQHDMQNESASVIEYLTGEKTRLERMLADEQRKESVIAPGSALSLRRASTGTVLTAQATPRSVRSGRSRSAVLTPHSVRDVPKIDLDSVRRELDDVRQAGRANLDKMGELRNRLTAQKQERAALMQQRDEQLRELRYQVRRMTPSRSVSRSSVAPLGERSPNLAMPAVARPALGDAVTPMNKLQQLMERVSKENTG